MRAKGTPFDPNAVLGFYNWFINSSGTSMQMKDGAVWHNEVAYFYSLGEGYFVVSYSKPKICSRTTTPSS